MTAFVTGPADTGRRRGMTVKDVKPTAERTTNVHLCPHERWSKTSEEFSSTPAFVAKLGSWAFFSRMTLGSTDRGDCRFWRTAGIRQLKYMRVNKCSFGRIFTTFAFSLRQNILGISH